MKPAASTAGLSRRRFRFGLRAFFVFVTVVAILAAWVGLQTATHHRQVVAVEKLTARNTGGTSTVIWDSKFARLPDALLTPHTPPYQPPPKGIWQNLRNPVLFRRVVMFASFPKGNNFHYDRDADGRWLIQREYVNGLTDTDMPLVASFTNLRSLWLEANGITDAGLVQLSNLSNLEILWLELTAISDAGLNVLANFSNLHDLNLAGTDVTDAAVPSLAKCRQLRRLNLHSTNITKDGIQALQRVLPDCLIED
jgi:Leucine Rich Repeat (LRR) protein